MRSKKTETKKEEKKGEKKENLYMVYVPYGPSFVSSELEAKEYFSQMKHFYHLMYLCKIEDVVGTVVDKREKYGKKEN